MANLSPDQLRRLARLGAMARLEQLRNEEAAIRAEFPELFGRGGRRAEQGTAEPAAGKTTGRGRGGRRKMSPAARKAVSERMRRYWADRRKTKGSK